MKFGQKTVARETMMLASELKSHLVDKLDDSAAMAKLKSCIKWVGLGQVQSFMFYSGLGRVESLHLWVWLGRVKEIGSTSNSALTTSQPVCKRYAGRSSSSST